MPIAVRPVLRPWIPPADTKAEVKYANLRTINLGLFDSPNQADRDVAFEEFKKAIKEDGFLYLENFGLTQDQIDLQFAIAENALINSKITDEEKKRLQWKYLDTVQAAVDGQLVARLLSRLSDRRASDVHGIWAAVVLF